MFVLISCFYSVIRQLYIAVNLKRTWNKVLLRSDIDSQYGIEGKTGKSYNKNYISFQQSRHGNSILFTLL